MLDGQDLIIAHHLYRHQEVCPPVFIMPEARDSKIPGTGRELHDALLVEERIGRGRPLDPDILDMHMVDVLSEGAGHRDRICPLPEQMAGIQIEADRFITAAGLIKLEEILHIMDELAAMGLQGDP